MAAPEVWWAVKSQAARTGVEEITYVEATSRQAAGQILPGSTVLGGPYKTEAAAQKAFPQGSHGTRKSGSATPTNPPTVNALPSDPLGAIGHWIGELVSHLTDAAMWRSIGWLALGIALIFAGVILWIKGNISPAQVAALAA